MAVVHEALDQLYEVSVHYAPRDQRFIGAIGFEFELLEMAFGELFDLCERYTDHSASSFNPSDTDILRFGSLAMSFIDHTTRLIKLVRTYFGADPGVGPLLQIFQAGAPNLIKIRNTLQHNYERIVSDRYRAERHPLCGEFVWYALTPDIKVDSYFMWFGPFIDESAGSLMSTGMTFRQLQGRKVIDHLTYSAFDIRFDVSDAWLAAVRLVEEVNALLKQRFINSMKANGLEVGGPDDQRLPANVVGKARMEGVELSSGSYPTN